MENFGNIKIEPPGDWEERQKRAEKIKKVNRRKLLKAGGAAVLLGAGGMVANKYLDNKVVKGLLKEIDSSQKKSSGKGEVEVVSVPEEVSQSEQTQRQNEQIKIEKPEEIGEVGPTVSDVLESDDLYKEINLDKEVIENTSKYWKKYYRTKIGEEDLRLSHSRMAFWLNDLREIFRNKFEGVDDSSLGFPIEDLAYLAIVETKMKRGNNSEVAVGPYQFIPKTAKGFNLMMTKDYDERNDPIIAGDACARHILEDFKRLKKYGVGPKEAVCLYNGRQLLGSINRRKRGNPDVYGDFLQFMEDKANGIRKEMVAKIRSDVRRRGYEMTSEGNLIEKKFNSKGLPLFSVGKKRKPSSSNSAIPKRVEQFVARISRKSTVILQEKLSGDKQNLNYWPKFVATASEIRRLRLAEKDARRVPKDRTWNEFRVNNRGIQVGYKVVAGDNLSKIRRKIALREGVDLNRVDSVESIRLKNNKRSNTIRPGEELKISIRSRQFKLRDYFKDSILDDNAIMFLNQAFKSPDVIVPDGALVRLPKKGREGEIILESVANSALND